MKIKIVIADDHPVVIDGLRHIIGGCSDMMLAGCYGSGMELLKALEWVRPDVLLLDIQMPGQTGDEVAEVVSRKYPKLKILVLTNFDNVYYIKNMLSKGVHGYLLKTSRAETLLNAIRTVYRGGHYLEPGLQEKIKLDDESQAKRLIGINSSLSRREKEILQYLASNMTSVQIAQKLFVSKRTVENHRFSLLVKFDVKNVAALVKKGIEMGLIK